MALHAVIGPQALKLFTKTLTCLSRYGDDAIIRATPDALTLCVTNSSKTAHSTVKLTSGYFDKYTLKPLAQPGMSFQTPPEVEDLTGQLLVKSLLSILRHKTVEKSVDRCDLSIVEGGQPSASHDENDAREEDSLASKLILRLHCKHGVVKTHRLLLYEPNTSPVTPRIPDTFPAHITVGPETLHDLLNHFPHSRGDPQVAWDFEANSVVLRSVEAAHTRDRGVSHLTTEISLSADEFDSYTIDEPPVSISFHLREFNAAVMLAESLSVALVMNFSLPAEPLIITFDTDGTDAEYLFIIATIHNKPGGRPNPLKRIREDDNGHANMAVKKSSRAAPSTASSPARLPSQTDDAATNEPSTSAEASHDLNAPLFLPGATQDAATLPSPPLLASQLPAADLDLVRSAGLGIEHMDYEEFEAMMDAEGEEVVMSTALKVAQEPTSEEEDQDMVMEASQAPPGRHGDREFRPLFDD